LEVACEPNSRIGTKSKLVDHPVPLTIDVPEVYWMVSSRAISMWTLHIRACEVKVKGCKRFHRDFGMVCVLVKKRRGVRGTFGGTLKKYFEPARGGCTLRGVDTRA